MKTTRRQFIKKSALGFAAAVTSSRWTFAAGSSPDREILAKRKRRIIFNDDGDELWHPDANTPEGFIDVRLRHMLNTQTDTLFYCTTQGFNHFSHRTKVSELFLSKEGMFRHNNMQTLLDLGTDPLKLAVEFAHANGIEAFWTLRMNDIHDGFIPPMFSQWKKDHPDAILGKREYWDKYAPKTQRHWWSGVNYQRGDVRERMVAVIEEVANNYDVDGIDLDWLRHPIHFPTTMRGEATTPQEIEILTNFVRDIRARLTRIEKKRGKTILLSTRVPLTKKHGLYMGTDIETWLKEGLIDFVITGGGYIPFTMPTREIAIIGHRYGVSVYPCISCSAMIRQKPSGSGGLYSENIYGIEAWRAVASNAFAEGADGISLFNLFPEPGKDAHNKLVRKAFSELGDPATLAGKDKLFCLDNETHLGPCGYFNHIIPFSHSLPRTLKPGTKSVMALSVSDVSGAKNDKVQLRIQFEKKAEVTLHFNGQKMTMQRSPELERRYELVWLTAVVPYGPLRKGQNQISIALNDSSAAPARLTGFELLVRYA